MAQAETGLFTIGVFEDLAAAERALGALAAHGFDRESLSIITRESEAAAAWLKAQLASDGTVVEARSLGPVRASGPLVGALQGDDGGLGGRGVAATIARVGFQAHDGHIFETLLTRGGVLVAIHSDPRAADALALLHAYGGGNAAIGAWAGRV